ncbi:hypothetical protein NKJ26_12860 [Mesorhizobium sp. M0152]|uniref:hypothetical protein n=1 Tax=Mesorhizobium sp. M0152 TaxID=2956898 RepID=UPI00333D6877
MIDIGPPPLVLARPAIIRPAPVEFIHPSFRQMHAGLEPDQAIAFMPGFRKPVAAPVDLAFQAITTHTNEAQTVTFTAVGIGAAAADRYVFILVPYYNGSTIQPVISSATIGGVAATIHASIVVASTTRGGCALISALVPTGATATIVLNFSASGAGFYRPRIGVYRVAGLQSTSTVDLLTYSNIGSNIPRTFTVNVAKDGLVIFGCFVYGNSIARTMSVMTPDFSVSPVGSVQYLGSGATTAASGTQSCTITGGTTAQWAVIMASFR